jgi:hypothetical protein
MPFPLAHVHHTRFRNGDAEISRQGEVGGNKRIRVARLARIKGLGEISYLNIFASGKTKESINNY